MKLIKSVYSEQEQQAAQVTQQQAEAAKAVADPDAQKGIQQAQEQLQGL